MRHRFFNHFRCKHNQCREICPFRNPANDNSIYSFKIGDTVQVISIKGPKSIRRHLISIGLLPGTLINILENKLGQTCLVSSENRKITIDRISAYALVVVTS
ncbi:MAG: ferrous iron transport protein A [Caldisericia bacterium]|nr:ferrous iron transport protein A [Caldisericia bacterium]